MESLRSDPQQLDGVVALQVDGRTGFMGGGIADLTRIRKRWPVL